MVIKRSVRPHASSVKLALFFVCVVSIILVLALSIRVIRTVQKSTFDGQHQFVLLLYTSSQSALLNIFSPTQHSITVFPVRFTAKEQIEGDMDIGIDAFLQSKIKTIDLQKALLGSLIFPQENSVKVTWFDIIQMYWLSKTDNISYQKEVDIAKLPESSMQTTASFFSDQDIVHENVAIQIINASGVSGEGKRLEQLLTNIGGNVIDVRTAIIPVDKSSITYYDKISYTANRLERILHYPLKQTQQKSIAGVEVVIGKDSASIRRLE